MKNAAFLIIIFFVSNSLLTAQSNYFTSFDGTKISYSDEGFGEAVLLLHGFLSSGKSWDNTQVKKDLLSKGYRVVIPDLRGCGQSDKPQEKRFYQHNAEVQDLKLLMDHLKIQDYAAIGYSRGSIILAELLMEDARISKAVLGGMGIDFTNPNWERRVAFANAFKGEVAEMTQGAVDYAKSIDADFRSLHLQQKYQPSTSKAALGRIKTEILVIAGDTDFDNGNPEALKMVFKKSELVIVPGDHNGTWKTREFSDEILKFL
ncbi:alpha/beta fold hydrolase [Maribacter sp. 4G9]|uniref:alpha/beta fold hydrolase n=1 Tax=Maribacter sp. 4G9 TaxID=1889777 RepID=UPI000C159344|nr:alpha/beta hydrolase [Maribacter sp. 4G9]PIB27822.1 alpha/beta hydrolase [Maribacter sp. 4G9]